MAIKIKHVQGNVLEVHIPLTIKTKTIDGGVVSEEEKPFYPNTEYPVTIELNKGGGLLSSYEATIEGNVVSFRDEGLIPIGLYQLQVVCKNEDGDPMRYMVRGVVEIVDATAEAGIEEGIEFNAEAYTLDGAIFSIARGPQGPKGDKGDPGTTDYNELENKPDLSGIERNASDIRALETDMRHVENQADINGENIAANAAAIDANTSSITHIDNRLDKFHTQRDKYNPQRWKPIEQYIEREMERIDANRDRLNQFVVDGETDTIEAHVNHINDVVAGDGDDINTLQSELGITNDNVGALTNKVNNIESNVYQIDNRVDRFEEEVEPKVSANTAAVSALNTRLDAFNGSDPPRTIESRISGLSARITTNANNIAANTTAIATKADAATTYTKEETNTLLDGKAEKNGSTSEEFSSSKVHIGSWDLSTNPRSGLLFHSKAVGSATLPLPTDVGGSPDKTIAYTDQIPDVSGKADAATVNAALAGKADKSDTYTKEQTDALIPDISGKANASDVTALAGRVTIAEGQIARKQDALVSGENIKTVNGQSLLGKGNITIEGGGDPYAALRAMYLAADPRPATDPDRLKYNAETGFYEMNRLTDITEEQMAVIFSYGRILSTYSKGALHIEDARTLYPISSAAYYVIGPTYFQVAPSIESIRLCSKTVTCVLGTTNIYNIFQNEVNNLRYILDEIVCQQAGFTATSFTAPALELVRLRGLKGDIYFTKCPKLNYESLRYLVANAANTVAITVTVHATTYGYLTGTIEPTEQVGGTSAEWQQIVADATNKNISFATA